LGGGRSSGASEIGLRGTGRPPEGSAAPSWHREHDGRLGLGEVADLESGGYVTAGTPLVLRQYLILEITVMAAKIAYENAAFVKNVVNNVWKVIKITHIK